MGHPDYGARGCCPARPTPRRTRLEAVVDQHNDAKRPRILPVRPHRRPDPVDPAIYARLPTIHTDESRTQGLDRLELIRFLQIAQTITVHHGAIAHLLGINALRASEAAAVRGRKADAERWLDEIRSDLVRGTYVDPAAGRVLFADFART